MCMASMHNNKQDQQSDESYVLLLLGFARQPSSFKPGNVNHMEHCFDVVLKYTLFVFSVDA